MLTIRREQMAALEAAATAGLEADMVQHLKNFRPKHCEAMTEPYVLDTVRLGLSEAGNYGLNSRGALRVYLECMVLCGSYFDRDPQFGWAAEILNSRNYVDQIARASALYRKATDYAIKVLGAKREFYLAAVGRMRQAPEIFSMPTASFEDSALQTLRAVFPQKARYCGDPALNSLIRWASETCQDLKLSGKPVMMRLVILGYLFGNGMANDPQFPWVRTTLSDLMLGHPNQRLERIYNEAQTYLSQTLK